MAMEEKEKLSTEPGMGEAALGIRKDILGIQVAIAVACYDASQTSSSNHVPHVM